jgi:hypothetical protein
MISVVAHRGMWNDPTEQNSLDSFRRAFANGFGIETDIRDFAGDVAIAHDPADASCPFLDELLALHGADTHPLYLNVKADGLVPRLADIAWGGNVRFFDMSAPQAVAYAKSGLPILTRISDVEREPVLVDRAHGMWVDALIGEWLDAAQVDELARLQCPLIFVSPELHGRAPEPLWALLRETLPGGVDASICTDLPAAADDYFNKAAG